jgi:hypothetical protein
MNELILEKLVYFGQFDSKISPEAAMKFLDTLINLNDDSEGKRKIFDIFKGV